MGILSIIKLFGGVGLFLFGMSLMGSSLEKLAGSGMGRILETLTTSKRRGIGEVKGWSLGLGVTGIIQSSAATTLMLIGFVNAGIMSVYQSIPVVFGSNIGSTVTAQILRLGDLSSDNIVLSLLKPSSFAPMLLAIGATIYLFSKKEKNRSVAGILIGLGILFYGMTAMEEVFAPLKESPQFQALFTSFKNPALGILTGLVLTAIIQSSSASVGILQALSASGGVTYGIAIPIIIGQNIGKCMPIIMGGIGATKKAKRVSLTYILFNIFGAALFCVVIYAILPLTGISFLDDTVNRGNIANIHLLFNLITSLVLLPLSGIMSKVTEKILKDSDVSADDEELKILDDMFLKTPGIALNQCIKIINMMGDRIKESFGLATAMLKEYDGKNFQRLEENEAFIDKCETVLSDYILKIDRKRLTRDNQLVVNEILNSIGDFERIGDYSLSVAYTSKEIKEKRIKFSKKGSKEIAAITDATLDTLMSTVEAFSEDSKGKAMRIEAQAGAVKKMNKLIKDHHIDRLLRGVCSVEDGVILYDILNSMERIIAHSTNVAQHIVKRFDDKTDFDEMHGHVMDTSSEEYIALENYYTVKYSKSIKS